MKDEHEMITPAAPGRIKDLAGLITFAQQLAGEHGATRDAELRAEGYRQAIADLRAEAFRLDGLVRAGHPLGNAAVALQVSAAADFLESRISQDQPGRDHEPQ